MRKRDIWSKSYQTFCNFIVLAQRCFIIIIITILILLEQTTPCTTSFFFSFLGSHNGNLDLVMRTLQEHLPLKINESTFFGTLEGTHQSLVIVGYLIIIKELSKKNMRFTGLSNSTNIYQQLGTFFIQTILTTIHFGIAAVR